MYCYKGTDGPPSLPPSLPHHHRRPHRSHPLRASSDPSVLRPFHQGRPPLLHDNGKGGKAGRRNECKLQVACDTFGDYSCVDCVILASCARGMQSICMQNQTCKCGGLRMREGRKGKALILFLCPFQPKFLSRSSPFRPTRVTRLMQYGGYYTIRC